MRLGRIKLGSIPRSLTMRTIIHVNRHIIDANRKHGERNPPLSVKNYKKTTNADTVEIVDAEGNVLVRVVHRPEKPLNCGAKVWIETELEVLTH